MAMLCLDLLNNELKENICGLTRTAETSFAGAKLPDGIAYACIFWAEHVCLLEHDVEDAMRRVHRFLADHMHH